MAEPAFSPKALLRPIFATRIFNKQLQFAVRGESKASESSWPRQYKAEDVDLSLHLSFTSKGERMLLGIITSSDPDEDVEMFEGVTVELYTAPGPTVSNGEHPSSPLLSSYLDDLGNFALKPVPNGQYVLVICLPGREMVIEDIIFE